MEGEVVFDRRQKAKKETRKGKSHIGQNADIQVHLRFKTIGAFRIA